MKTILHFKEKCLKGAHALENDVETQGDAGSNVIIGNLWNIFLIYMTSQRELFSLDFYLFMFYQVTTYLTTWQHSSGKEFTYLGF